MPEASAVVTRKSKRAVEPSSKEKPARPAKGNEDDGNLTSPAAGALRIIGGAHRGRKLRYSGDMRTRPMKDRVREAVFNLLGPQVAGRHAIDLFAGTGALGLEALSRGAAYATFYEQHFPTAAIIRENIATLGLEDRAQVIAANTFIQFRRALPAAPAQFGPLAWLVFASPPYDFYVDRAEEMLKLLTTISEAAPAGSIVVVEADERFDFAKLGHAGEWDLREYLPARIAIHRFENAAKE
jgi:16S rRNA (guanine966-N2)-methyltransferase